MSRRVDRAQLVLLAAGVLAVALAPLVLAYLQLGAHPDVAATADRDRPVANAERVLERGVHESVEGVPVNFTWSERTAATATVRTRLADHFETLRRARLADGVAYRVGYNDSAAATWANESCPGGPGRQFGDCVTDGGLVLQERANRTHVVAVALDVRAVTERGFTAVTLVVGSAVGDQR